MRVAVLNGVNLDVLGRRDPKLYGGLGLAELVELFTVPVVEVHLSKIEEREEWRRQSVLGELATRRITGKGPDGYREALEFLAGRR